MYGASFYVMTNQFESTRFLPKAFKSFFFFQFSFSFLFTSIINRIEGISCSFIVYWTWFACRNSLIIKSLMHYTYIQTCLFIPCACVFSISFFIRWIWSLRSVHLIHLYDDNIRHSTQLHLPIVRADATKREKKTKQCTNERSSG